MTRPDTRRALFRHHLYIQPWDKVRASFILTGPDDVRGVFECVVCETEMLWNPEKQYWECPECEYELTPGEARDLHELIRNRLNQMYGRRSWVWALLTWWRRRREDPPKLPPPPT